MTRDLDGRVEALAARHALPAPVAEKLRRLLDLLADPMAPTSVHDPRAGVDVHLADSLVALDLPAVRAARLLADLGAGAGLPGLVLAAGLPDCRVVLVESVGRKARWMAASAERLKLENVEVAAVRAEEWQAGLGRCDVVTARALASLPVLCEYAAPLLTEPAGDRAGGLLAAWKGAAPEEEARDGRAAAAVLGLGDPEVLEVSPYPGSERRTVWTFRKVAPTPPGYPRRPGLAAKRPLRAGRG